MMTSNCDISIARIIIELVLSRDEIYNEIGSYNQTIFLFKWNDDQAISCTNICMHVQWISNTTKHNGAPIIYTLL